MDIYQYLDKIKDFEQNLLDYLDTDSKLEEHPILISFLKNQFQRKKQQEIKETLLLISNIANDHHRTPNFFDKIDKLLFNFTDEIKQTFSNFELFSIFKDNKRILLFFIKQSLLIIDQPVFDVINDNDYWDENYIKYFFPESKPFLHEKLIQEIEEELKIYDSETYEKNRKNGENDQYICQLIRNDLIDDFIIYVNENNFSITSNIKHSIFETNKFLNSKFPSLIEYSSFYGAIQILKYLTLNKVEMKSSLWFFAIHGKNPEFIHFLEENNIVPYDKTYKECYEESVKCYNNDIANYFIDSKLLNNKYDEICFKNRNYILFPDDIQQPIVLFYLCSYN